MLTRRAFTALASMFAFPAVAFAKQPATDTPQALLLPENADGHPGFLSTQDTFTRVDATVHRVKLLREIGTRKIVSVSRPFPYSYMTYMRQGVRD